MTSRKGYDVPSHLRTSSAWPDGTTARSHSQLTSRPSATCSGDRARPPRGPAPLPQQRVRTPCVPEQLLRIEETLQGTPRSEEHTSELQSRQYLVCRLLLEKKQSL